MNTAITFLLGVFTGFILLALAIVIELEWKSYKNRKSNKINWLK